MNINNFDVTAAQISEWVIVVYRHSAIFQLPVYHGENKLIFNEMMMGKQDKEQLNNQMKISMKNRVRQFPCIKGLCCSDNELATHFIEIA